MKSFKKFVVEKVELDEAVMQGSKEHLKKLQGMLDKVKPGSVDHSQIRGAIESKFGKQHIPAKHRNVKPDMYEEVELDEKLKASDDMGTWVKDFQDSDAPQFKGKSQKKRQQMAIAAKLAAERNEEVELDEVSNATLQRYKSKAGKVIDNSENEREVKKRGKGYALASRKLTDRLTKESVELDEAETKYVIKHKKTKEVLNTHDDYATAKDEHEGLGVYKKDYGVYKQTKKDSALRNRNTYREEVELEDYDPNTQMVKREVQKANANRKIAAARNKALNVSRQTSPKQ